jgi:hypothetical protein
MIKLFEIRSEKYEIRSLPTPDTSGQLSSLHFPLSTPDTSGEFWSLEKKQESRDKNQD